MNAHRMFKSAVCVFVAALVPTFIVYGQTSSNSVSDNHSASHVFAQVADGRLSDGTSYRSTLVIQDRKSTRLNSSHIQKSRMPSSA